MCTAITLTTHDHYFGRNLDLEYSYQEEVTITPRNYPFVFRHMGMMKCHYAMIGMAFIQRDYPLYYDATNEKGLSIAGLNFPENAHYFLPQDECDSIAQFELIPWILGQCSTVAEAKEKLKRLRITSDFFEEGLPVASLHWILSDASESVVIESTKEGLQVYFNPIGVLTNNPPFSYHQMNINNYMHLSSHSPKPTFSSQMEFQEYCKGMGAIGLPGDLSSSSRFIKAAFTRANSVSGNTEAESVSQFFHVLKSVEQQRGCVVDQNGQYEITVYSSCCNTTKGIYYYTTYENSQISAVYLYHENIDGDTLISYPLITAQQIHHVN